MLIIKGDMPINCVECEGHGFNVCSGWLGSQYCTERSPKCPILCEIPDKHGDLIDRQAVLSYFETAFLMGADMDYEDIVGIVSNPKAIPTIVEATE